MIEEMPAFQELEHQAPRNEAEDVSPPRDV